MKAHDFSRKTHYTVSVIVIKNNKLLLLKQERSPFWLLPGGHIEENELPHETAVREVLEETGLKIELLQKPDARAKTAIAAPLPIPLGIRVLPCRTKKDIDLVFSACVKSGRLRLNSESQSAHWFSGQEMQENYKVGPNTRYFALQLLKPNKKTTKTRFKNWEEKYKKHGILQKEVMQIAKDAVPILKKRKAKKILDLACGTGRHTLFLAKKGFHVTGMDNSKTALQITRKQLKKKRIKNARVCFGRMRQIPFKKESFGAVVCTRAIYHGTSKQIQKTIAEVYRVLRPKGLFLFNVLATNHPDYGKGKQTEKNTFIHVHDSEYGVPHHFFFKQEIQRVLSGFNILGLKPVHYPDLADHKPHEFEIMAEKDEVFEYFSVAGKKRGLATRKKIHESKRIYWAAHVLVFNSKGELFVQERAKTKDVYPGFWAPSASGHVNPGEKPKQAALRELQEELGIKTKIVLLGKIKCFTPVIRELLAVFMAKTSQRIRFNKNEIENGFFVPLDWAYKNLENKKFLPALKKELIVFKKKITQKKAIRI